MKSFKRCPRCNKLVAYGFNRCGECGLSFDKFNSATNAEAKSAFRMGEKERVLYSKRPPDIDKPKMIIQAIFGGWFGLHDFSVGRLFRGLYQVIGFIFGIIYVAYSYNHIRSYTPLGYFMLALGIVWAVSVVIWMIDTIAIIFNRYKYPVSLPYKAGKKGE